MFYAEPLAGSQLLVLRNEEPFFEIYKSLPNDGIPHGLISSVFYTEYGYHGLNERKTSEFVVDLECRCLDHCTQFTTSTNTGVYHYCVPARKKVVYIPCQLIEPQTGEVVDERRIELDWDTKTGNFWDGNIEITKQDLTNYLNEKYNVLYRWVRWTVNGRGGFFATKDYLVNFDGWTMKTFAFNDLSNKNAEWKETVFSPQHYNHDFEGIAMVDSGNGWEEKTETIPISFSAPKTHGDDVHHFVVCGEDNKIVVFGSGSKYRETPSQNYTVSVTGYMIIDVSTGETTYDSISEPAKTVLNLPYSSQKPVISVTWDQAKYYEPSTGRIYLWEFSHSVTYYDDGGNGTFMSYLIYVDLAGNKGHEELER